MGNNPSKSLSGDAPSTSGPSNINTSLNEKKIARRPSLNALSGTAKATAADPSASKETATGYSAAQNPASVQQRLQSRNVADSPTRNLDRSSRRDAKISDSELNDIPDPSNPVQVPASRAAAKHDPFPPATPSAPLSSAYYNASTHLQRPPRMPLPIGDATATPGSPIIGPPDGHIDSLPQDRLLDEQGDTSNIGSATVDEDELVDELQPYTVSGVGKAIPTVIPWTGPGHKVYVTGTFVNWEKKFRLHRRYVVSRLVSYSRGVASLRLLVAKYAATQLKPSPLFKRVNSSEMFQLALCSIFLFPALILPFLLDTCWVVVVLPWLIVSY